MEPLQIRDVNSASINIINPDRVVRNDTKIQSDSSNLKSNLVVDVTNDVQSKFSNKLTNTIDRVSSLQNLQSTVNTQINVVNEINSNIQSATSIELLDKVQPTVKNLMDNFNSNMEGLDLNQILFDHESVDSHTYFDGTLGSKPLSPSKIMEATENSMRLLESLKSNLDTSHDVMVNEIKNNISQEREVSQQSSPFKDVNFGKESSDFTSSSINNTVGSIATIQTNPSTSHTIRLLSQ